MKKFIYLSFSLLCFFALRAGDIVTLKNDMKFDGTITKLNACTIEFFAEGGIYEIPATEISSIKFANPNNKLLIAYLASDITNDDNCLKGQLDAETYHGKKGGHFVLGMLFGPFAMVGTAISNPTPDCGKRTYMMSENKEVFNDLEYLSCYKKQAKKQLIIMEGLGWATWLLLVLI